MVAKVLTIAGSDPSGGAGIQADLKTFSAMGCYGMAVITALTAQNTKGVQGGQPVSADFLELQLRSIFDDVPPDAIKIGMLGDVESIERLAALLKEYNPPNIVLDPVMASTSGEKLVSGESIEVMKTHLIPLASVVTPNRQEMQILGCDDARGVLKNLKAQAVLLTGGDNQETMAVDLLVSSAGAKAFEALRIHTYNNHGTGCTLSAAIAAELAKGNDLRSAVATAKAYTNYALRHADDLDIGEGPGPLHHFWHIWKKGDKDKEASAAE